MPALVHGDIEYEGQLEGRIDVRVGGSWLGRRAIGGAGGGPQPEEHALNRQLLAIAAQLRLAPRLQIQLERRRPFGRLEFEPPRCERHLVPTGCGRRTARRAGPA